MGGGFSSTAHPKLNSSVDFSFACLLMSLLSFAFIGECLVPHLRQQEASPASSQ